MKDIIEDINKKCEVVENDLQREIITQFYLANIPLEKCQKTVFVLGERIIEMHALAGEMISDHHAASYLVDIMRPQIHIKNAIKTALSGMRAMADVLNSGPSLTKKKKKNWKAKNIWDREGI